MLRSKFGKLLKIARLSSIFIAGAFIVSCVGTTNEQPESSSSVSSSESSISLSQSSQNQSSIDQSKTDSDSDGIIDSIDQCDDTAAKDRGQVESDGCTPYQRGKKIYFSGEYLCSFCHGNDGAKESKAILNDTTCDHVQGDCNIVNVARYVSENMPSPGKCVDSSVSTCATDVTTFIFEEFFPEINLEDPDADGIYGDADKCPNTEKEFRSSINSDGCKNIAPPQYSHFIAVNAAGPRYVTKDGTVFLADDDKYHTLRGEGTVDKSVGNTVDDTIYHSEAWGEAVSNFQYFFDVPDGDYRVIMHFVEMWGDSPGGRVFMIEFEEEEVFPMFDTFARAGGKERAAVVPVDVTVKDGQLNIGFYNLTSGHAHIHGLEIQKASDNDGDGDGVADRIDSCPGTIVGANTNESGCSDKQRDRDGDGVLIPEDICLSTPSSQTGSVDTSGPLAGCSAQERSFDTDKDGVPDVIDNCDSIESEKVGATGCSGIAPLVDLDVQSPQMRLTGDEYIGAVKKAFNVNSVGEVTLQGDSKGPFNVYFNNAGETVTNYSALVKSAVTVAEYLANNLVGSCNWKSDTSQCVDMHLEEPMKVLFKETSISDSDLKAVSDVFATASAQGAEDKFALTAAISLILLDERFSYQLEHGSVDANGEQALSNRELAARLSLFLTDLPPDTAVVENPNDISSHTQIMQMSEAYHEVVWKFVAQWLNLPESKPEGNALEESAYEETRRFVRHVMSESKAPFKELFTAEYSFIDSRLAQHYGVANPSNDWDKYDFPESSKRKGILTHASFLIKNGRHGDDINTIYRGKVVFERLFCNRMPAPPDDLDPVVANAGTSDRSKAEACRGCHENVDPLGRIFDLYGDEGGQLKPAGSALSGAVSLDVDIYGDYASYPDLADKFAESYAVSDCVTRQIYRFALGREARLVDQPSFDEVRNTIDEMKTFNEVVRSFVTSDSFKMVHTKAKQQMCPVGG